MIKIKNRHILSIDLCRWTMSQMLPVNGFKWVENAPQFNEDFIKRYNEESDEGYFLDVHVKYPEKLHDLHMIYLFYLKE